MHIGHAGEETAVQVGGDQQQVIHAVTAGFEGGHHQARAHPGDLHGLQHRVAGEVDLPDDVIGGRAEHHFAVAGANQRDHVDIGGIGNVGGEPVMPLGILDDGGLV